MTISWSRYGFNFSFPKIFCQALANSANREQTAPRGSGSALFAILSES